MKHLLIVLPLFLQSSPLAESYNAKILKTKDYEEMREILNRHITSSQSDLTDGGEDVDSAVSELKKGLKILLMRPDTDAIKSSLILTVQNEIIKYRSFMAVFGEVVKTAIDEFKSKKGSVAYQASLLYLIENSLSYLDSINNKESNKILKSIKKAKLKTGKKVFNYLLLEMGRGKTASPSYLAGQILKKRVKEARRQKAKAEKAKQKALKKKAENKKKKQKKWAEKKSEKEEKRQPSSLKPKKQEKPFKHTVEIDL